MSLDDTTLALSDASEDDCEAQAPPAHGPDRGRFPEVRTPCDALRSLAALDWVTSASDLDRWIADCLAPALGTSMALLSAGSPHATLAWQESRRYCHRFPLELWNRIRANNATNPASILRTWIAQRRPLFVGPTNGNAKAINMNADHIARPDISTMLLHGVLDPSGCRGILLVAINPCFETVAATRHHLELILPKLYRIVSSLPQQRTEPRDARVAQRGETAGKALSAAEQQVLEWLSAGKTNWEIAKILGRSENTVKHQAGSIFAKLDVTTRAQASQWFRHHGMPGDADL